ncbi:TetR/AcrR family transcriptional regulator [Helicobacter sp. 23-1045]
MAKVTKEQIIEKTRKYLKSLGVLKSISLCAILRYIGISKGVFYYHFKDKDELLYEVMIPEIRKKEAEISKHIATLPTLKERLHFMFELYENEKLEKELKAVENFTIYFFFESSDIGKLKAFKNIHNEIIKSRKTLIHQQIRYYNIKITKDISILVDYIIETMIFYHIYHKKLNGKSPRREIISVIDMLCKMLDKK